MTPSEIGHRRTRLATIRKLAGDGNRFFILGVAVVTQVVEGFLLAVEDGIENVFRGHPAWPPQQRDDVLGFLGV